MDFNRIPWNHPMKYKKLCQNLKRESYVIYDIKKIIEGITEAMFHSYLASHAASALKLLCKQHHLAKECLLSHYIHEICKPNVNPILMNLYKQHVLKEFLTMYPDTIKDIVNSLLYCEPEVPLYSAMVILTLIYNLNIKEYVPSCDKLEEYIKPSSTHPCIEIRLACLRYYYEIPITTFSLSEVRQFIKKNVFVADSTFRNEQCKILNAYIAKIKLHGCKAIRQQEDLTHIVVFLEWLGRFILNCLNCGTYQSKKTSLFLLDAVLLYFMGFKADLNNSTRIFRKNYLKVNCSSLITYLKVSNAWYFTDNTMKTALLACLSDSDEDITSTCKNLLFEYFQRDITSTEVADLRKSAKKLCKKFIFYRIRSAASMYDIAVRIENSKDACISKSLHALQIYAKMFQTDAVKVVMENNVHMYTFLLLLNHLSDLFKQEQTDVIINLLQIFVPGLLQLLKPENSENEAPTFADMACSLRKIVEVSQTEINEDELLLDEEQLLLNKIWLNLKACCELATSLAQNDKRYSVHDSCFRLLLHISMSTRHKGLIEAAGHEVFKLVKFLTSNQLSSEIVDQHFFNVTEVIADATRKSSYSRRAAGLSILILKMISADKRQEKILLKVLMRSTLDVLSSDELLMKESLKTEYDSRITVALHSITRLVHDSSLWPNLRIYVPELIDLSLKYNQEQYIWSIKNGALLLFNTLCNKIIGQNHAFDIQEMYDCYPSVLKILAKRLQCEADPRILSIIQRLIVFTMPESKTLWTILQSIYYSVSQYISHHDARIRRYSAKAFASLCIMEDIPNAVICAWHKIISQNKMSSNQIDGLIVVIHALIDRLHNDGLRMFADDIYIMLQNEIKLSLLFNKNLQSCKFLQNSFNDLLIRVSSSGLKSQNTSSSLLKTILKALKKNDIEIAIDLIDDIENFDFVTTEQEQLLCSLLLKQCVNLNFSGRTFARIQDVLPNFLKNSVAHVNCNIENILFWNNLRTPLKAILLKLSSNSQSMIDSLVKDLLQDATLDSNLNRRLDAAHATRILMRRKYTCFKLYEILWIQLGDIEEEVCEVAVESVRILRNFHNMHDSQIFPEHCYAARITLISESAPKTLNSFQCAKLALQLLLYENRDQTEENDTCDRINPFIQRDGLPICDMYLNKLIVKVIVECFNKCDREEQIYIKNIYDRFYYNKKNCNIHNGMFSEFMSLKEHLDRLFTFSV